MVDFPQMLNKIVFAGKPPHADTIAAFKGTVQLGTVRRTNMDRAVMAVERSPIVKWYGTPLETACFMAWPALMPRP